MAGPGRYQIQFLGEGQAAIFSRDGKRVDDLQFVAKANDTAVFIFELVNMEPPPVFRFSDPPIAWTKKQARHSEVELDSDVQFTITVHSHTRKKEKSYPFQVKGIEMWLHGNPPDIDPTIVEKPPDSGQEE